MVDPGPIEDVAEPDDGIAHGEAAIVLVESLIHILVARSVISVEDAVEVLSDAIDVRSELARERDIPPAGEDKSVGILKAMSASLSIDLPGESARPWPPHD